MELKEIKIERRLIPEWNNNKELPVDEQVVIYFSRIPGTSEKTNYINLNFSQSGSTGISYNDNQLLAAFVEKVDNLKIGKRIKSGRDLATASHPSLAALITEIRDYLFPDDDELLEGESQA